VVKKILGLDPGTASLGFAILENTGSLWQAVVFDCLHTTKDQPMPERVLDLYQALRRIVRKYRPDAIACEQLFFNKNVRTALSVGAIIGVITLLSAQERIPLFTYTPLQVKMAIVGYGRATKTQVQKSLTLLLALAEDPHQDDAADALAVALCHSHSLHLRRLLEADNA
jgi:crossover junction endodeoxyribonuclease RuvC